MGNMGNINLRLCVALGVITFAAILLYIRYHAKLSKEGMFNEEVKPGDLKGHCRSLLSNEDIK